MSILLKVFLISWLWGDRPHHASLSQPDRKSTALSPMPLDRSANFLEIRRILRRWVCYDNYPIADVAELVDALDLGSSFVRSEGSSPFIRMVSSGS